MPPSPSPLRLRPMVPGSTVLTGSILKARFDRNVANLFERIDVQALRQVYSGEHDPSYAEPEFCGKYVDTAVRLAGHLGRRDYLDRAAGVVQAMIAGQRGDGCLATYRAGAEFEGFGVWNQQFTIRGLLAFHEATGDRAALTAACRCADFLVASLTREGGPDLLNAGNQGIQHSCILADMARLAAATGNGAYLDFCLHIVDRWEASNLRLVSSADRYFAIGCVKAAEMLICYQGLCELARAAGDKRYVQAAGKYWDCIRRTQIGLTGCGSLAENWWMVGGQPAYLGNSVHPNENCVAVSWMKLSAMLLRATGEGAYGDAFEQTLLNHLLGSQATDGHDFSYYQGLIGRKVHFTSAGSYSCCRYRGMNLLADLPAHVVLLADDGPAVNLFTPSVSTVPFGPAQVRLTQRTDYPRTGRVELDVELEQKLEFCLRMRMPAWCPKCEIEVDGQKSATQSEDGFLCLRRPWPAGKSTVAMDFCSAGSKVRMDSRVAPKNSQRRGHVSETGQTSRMPPRRAACPGACTSASKA